jgi:hypothetical protein
VRLARLIALAGLTPAQALEIGAGLLAAVTERSEPVGGGLDYDQVMVDADGRVVLGRLHCGGHAAPMFASAEAVLAEVADVARRRFRRPDPLLSELEQAVALMPRVDASVVARMLGDACAAIDRDGVRAELSALVRAIDGSSTVSVVGSASPRAPADRARPLERPTIGRGRVVRRRVGAWLLSVAVVVTVVLLEIAFLGDDIIADVDLLLDAGRSGSAPSAAAEPDGIPVVPPAPAAAGVVTAVDLRALGRCTPGAPCTMRVVVRLVPGAEPQTVTWSIRVVDRCTGVAETVPGGSVVVPPGAEQAAVVDPVALPQTAAAAVLAVTERPAAAASPPVLVGSCPPGGPAV